MESAEVVQIRLISVLALAAVSAAARPAHAVDPVPSFRYLVTGNGFGFQVFDVNANAVKQYLEKPYRYIRANSANPDGEGLVRRNLVFDTYFGARVGSQAMWFGGRTPTEVGYVEETNVIRSVVTMGSVTAESFYFAPFGYEGNAMVMLLKVSNAGAGTPVSAYSIHNFKLGSAPNPDEPGANGESVSFDMASATATESGPGGGVVVYAPIGGVDVSSCNDNAHDSVAAGSGLTMQMACTGADRKNAFAREMGTMGAGDTKWWGVAILFDESGNAGAAKQAWTTFLAGRAPDKLLADTLAEWAAWRKPPPAGISPAETKIWRQSEAVLRMSQILEPYQETPRRKSHGMVLASLPPGGWHTAWVRDAAYALVAMARTGHHEMAKKGIDFFLDADAGKFGSFLNDVDYRVSTVRYFGDGEEDADYSGQPTRNIEIDGWGLVLWAARQYVDASMDTAWLAATTKKGDSVYDALREGVAEPLIKNLEPTGMAIADASIWEVHWGNRQHFMYTTATVARGLCDMATLARRAGRTDDIERYREYAKKANEAIKTHFIDSNRVLAGSLERLAGGSNYRDGSTVESITWNLIAPDHAISKATLGAMSFLQTPAGGYKRLEGSNDQYDTDEWILIDLRASNAFRRAGDTAKADQLLGWVSAQASVNYDLLPELYNTRTSSGTIGAYSGSIPMVGYGAGAYQLTLLDRAGIIEPNDCGQYEAGEDPDPTNPGDDEDDGLGRGGFACACSGGQASPEGALLVLLVGLALVRRRR